MSEVGYGSKCPVCQGEAVSRCRCFLADTRCAKGHTWHRCPIHEKVNLGSGHGKGRGCTCEGGEEKAMALNAEMIKASGKIDFGSPQSWGKPVMLPEGMIFGKAAPLSFGQFLSLVAKHDTDALTRHGCPYVSVEKAAMTSASGALGGYLLTPELRMDLMRDVGEQSIVRRFAEVVPMTTAEVLLPLPDAQTAVAAGLPPYFGGMSYVWETEAAARDESDPAFRQVALKAWELSGEVLASNVLLADSPALEARLRTLFARCVAWIEDQAFLVGDGVGKPKGVHANATLVTRSGANAFADADARNMVEKLLPSSWPQALWVVHPSVMVKMPQLTGWQPNATREPARGPAGTLHELPLYVSDKLPALGTTGDVLLCDLSLYVIGDRGLLIDASEHVLFRTNQTVFRIVARVGGSPWLAGTLTLADGTKTAGAYVALTT